MFKQFLLLSCISAATSMTASATTTIREHLLNEVRINRVTLRYAVQFNAEDDMAMMNVRSRVIGSGYEIFPERTSESIAETFEIPAATLADGTAIHPRRTPRIAPLVTQVDPNEFISAVRNAEGVVEQALIVAAVSKVCMIVRSETSMYESHTVPAGTQLPVEMSGIGPFINPMTGEVLPAFTVVMHPNPHNIEMIQCIGDRTPMTYEALRATAYSNFLGFHVY